MQGAEASVRNLAYVEVRKNIESTTWYDAFFLDLVGDRVVVSFENEVWPDRELPCSSVRGRLDSAPEAQAAAVAKLQAGDPVEVRVAASSRNPKGWALGQVVATRDGFFEVALAGVKAGGFKDLILQADALRPVSQEAHIDPLYVLRSAVLIDEALRDWLSSLDARGCVEQVRQMAGLSHAGIGSDEHGIFSEASAQRIPDSVVLIGDESAVRRAHLLLQVHMMHQHEVEAFHERRRHKLSLLKDVLAKCGNTAQITFEVDVELVGRTVGANFQHAKRVESQHGVEIRVADGDTEDAPATVRILGETDEAIEKARLGLELLRVEYPVAEDRIDWIRGKGREDVLDIQEKAGLVYAKWNGSALELCGLRECIEDAELLLDHLMDYFPIYQSMVQQNEEIQESFEALDVVAVKTGARRPSSQKRRTESPAPKSNDKGKKGGGRGRQDGRQSSEAKNAQTRNELNSEETPSDSRELGNVGRSRGGRNGARGRGGRQSNDAPNANIAEDLSSKDVPSSESREVGDSARSRGGRNGARGRGAGGRPIGEGNTEGKAVWRARKLPESTGATS